MRRFVQNPRAFSGINLKDIQLPATMERECGSLDAKLFVCQFQDFYAAIQRHQELVNDTDFAELSEQIRKAELQVSLSQATDKNLDVVRERIVRIEEDREKRFGVAKDIVEEVSLRELNLYLKLKAPSISTVLELRPTSAKGVFGQTLELAGEPLPIG